MKSQKPGRNILKEAEVTGITINGIWILIHDHEYFLSYKKYPWFKTSIVKDIYNLKLLHENHLYWPNLDVDIELMSLIHPEKYPLVFEN
ncbi:MAG: DUF2442 domain-containing protein [Bdellovibrionales bacterium]